MAKSQRDITGNFTSGAAIWAVTNHTADRTMDCNDASTSGAITRDILGTLIDDLIAQGVLNGTVTA